MLYALRTPAGDLIAETIADSIDDVWDGAWEYGCANGAGLLPANWDNIEDEEGPKNRSKYFLRRFYKKHWAMRQYMRRKGYKIVKVRLVEITT